jgi:hypothetical protein
MIGASIVLAILLSSGSVSGGGVSSGDAERLWACALAEPWPELLDIAREVKQNGAQVKVRTGQPDLSPRIYEGDPFGIIVIPRRSEARAVLVLGTRVGTSVRIVREGVYWLVRVGTSWDVSEGFGGLGTIAAVADFANGQPLLDRPLNGVNPPGKRCPQAGSGG